MPYQMTAHKNEFPPARLLASLTLQSISLQSRQWNRKRPERKCGVFPPVTFAIAAWNIQKFPNSHIERRRARTLIQIDPEISNSWKRSLSLKVVHASGAMLRKTTYRCLLVFVGPQWCPCSLLSPSLVSMGCEGSGCFIQLCTLK